MNPGLKSILKKENFCAVIISGIITTMDMPLNRIGRWIKSHLQESGNILEEWMQKLFGALPKNVKE